MEVKSHPTIKTIRWDAKAWTFARSDGKLSIAEKVGYGLGDMASNILYQAWSFFLMIFYTDVFGITPKVASFMFLITRVWDMINDPIMGMIADRTKTPWGKFRPYLLWMAVPYGILAYTMFITPEWSQSMKIVYAYVTYILATMAYTAINIPYSSLMAVMTPDPKERTTLSQYRFFFAFIGGMLLVTTFTRPLAKFFGAVPSHSGYSEELGYSQALGFQTTMGVFGTIAIALLVITFLTTRERVTPPVEQKSSFKKDIQDVSKNIPWIVIFIAAVFWLIHNMIRNGMVAYYFDYVNGNGSNILWTFSIGALKLDFDQTTTFLTIGTFGMIAGVLISTYLKNRFDRKMVIIFLSLASAFVNLLFYWLPTDNFVILGLVNFIWSVIAGAMPVFLFSMFADVADFHEWKFNQRATGLVTAGIMFAIKMGVAIGGFLALYILDLYGYDSQASITPHIVNGIKLLFSVIPAGFIFVCGIILFFYPVNEKLLVTIERDLKNR
ncbi:MFS transporter [candidate division KSB1 bacterium]|nr:MFS transporter [candidate division KSB1 bacterium]RQW05415.1 MAG: MFS transporter [candidate division KSB1 bacterium]